MKDVPFEHTYCLPLGQVISNEPARLDQHDPIMVFRREKSTRTKKWPTVHETHFTGGMQIATDSTAGERERGSLEPLLVNPTPRHVFAAGKWLAATLAAMLSVIITTTLVLVMLRYIPLQELGIRFRIGPAQIAGILGALLPMCLMATSLQAYLATFARSFKEAQSYMGLLIMLPMIPGMLTTVYPITSQPWMYPIPVVGQHVLATDVLGGKPAPVWAFLVAGAAAIVVALGLVRLTTGLLQRERIIFSR